MTMLKIGITSFFRRNTEHSARLYRYAVCCFILAVANSSVLAGEDAPRVDGYRGIWFTLGQMSELGDKYSGGLGTYTANHNPMAVYSEKADKTFFTYGGTIKDQRHLSA